MKDTADQSAELMQAFKKDLTTPELEREAIDFPLEWDEAVMNVEQGYDFAIPGSLVANYLASNRSRTR